MGISLVSFLASGETPFLLLFGHLVDWKIEIVFLRQAEAYFFSLEMASRRLAVMTRSKTESDGEIKVLLNYS